MASQSNYVPPEKSLAQVLSEFKDELKDFAATRIAMLRAEMKEKVTAASAALPAIAAGAVFAIIGLLFLSVCVVAIVAMLLGATAGPWAAGFAIVGGLLVFVGAISLALGIRKLNVRALKPERTLRVLKQDQIWFQNVTRRER